MLQFSEDNALNSDTVCPAQILGFVQYETRGVPTLYLVHSMGLSLEEIDDDNIVDDTMYIMVHASSQWLSLSLSLDILVEEFVASFVSGDIDSCLYIILM